MGLHIREKKNKSGSISIQIVDRKNRGYKVVETIGCAKTDKEKRLYLSVASSRLKELNKKLYPTLFDSNSEDELEFINLANKELIPIGDELIYGKIFEKIGCHTIDLDSKKLKLFKALVISRLLYPGSKLYLIDYLEYFKQESIDKNQIYRFLDTLYQEDIKNRIEKCIFKHTKKIMDNTITITFYDVTTLYFESESEDDLRRIGFSKEGKLARPQIQLGLFTTLEGYPLSYEVYDGKKYEGHTLLEALINFQKRFQLKNKPIVVADRGMLNDANIAFLENNGYKYILGAKIKMLPNTIKEKIENLTFIDDSVTHQININKTIKYTTDDKKHSLDISQRLILSFSSSRAKKDKHLRDKALEKLKAKIEYSRNLTKNDLKLSHYAKYLDLENDCKVEFKLNNQKVIQDSKLDGIKGFLTNDTKLPHNEIISHYQNLWHIEKAFRISKTDLQIRPIYHRLESRIKAHILISFVAYAVYKEFERKLKMKDVKFTFSQKLLRDIIKHMYALDINGKLLYFKFDDIQQNVYDAIKD